MAACSRFYLDRELKFRGGKGRNKYDMGSVSVSFIFMSS